MPFTLAHPAAVVPLRGRWVLSALVVGSLMPDLVYLLPQLAGRGSTHSLEGLFLFCLPVGLVCLAIYHLLLKDPLLALLPASHQQRLMGDAGHFAWVPPRRTALILASLLLGAFTHILWDSFTHAYGWMVVRLPPLSQSLHTPLGVLPIYKILQHGSTLVGLALLAYWYMRWLGWPAQSLRSVLAADWRWWGVVSLAALLAVALFGGLAYLSVAPITSFSEFTLLLWRTMRTGGAVLLALLFLYSGIWHIWKLLR